MAGKFEARLKAAEGATVGTRDPVRLRYERLRERYAMPSDPVAQHAPAVALRNLLHALRRYFVAVHYVPQLRERLHPGVLAVLNNTGVPADRLWPAVFDVALDHATTGAPLELPLPLAEAWAQHPSSHAHEPDPVPVSDRAAQVGRVLSRDMVTCERCGLAHPSVDASERNKHGGWNVKTQSFFQACTFCEGRLGHAAFYNRHGHYPNGLKQRLNVFHDRLPGVPYPPEAWEGSENAHPEESPDDR